MELKTPKHLKIGKIGEDIACRFLENKGYKVLERNFKRKWGEIDIVCAKKDKPIGFLSSMWNKNNKNVLRGINNDRIIFVEVKTLKNSRTLNPEDNLTPDKQRKLIRTCQLYISEKRLDSDTDWQIDAILINLDILAKKAKVKHVKAAIY